MSSKSRKDTIQDVTKQQLSKNRPFNIKEITIPFSSLLDHVNPSDIYNGEEKIPFKKQHPEYQKILLNEFVE
jgi:hypothetical protein